MIQIYDLLDLRNVDRHIAGQREIPRYKLDKTASSRQRHVWRRPIVFGRHHYLDTLSYVAGTPGIWNSSGGSGFGATITCTSLAIYTGGTTVGCRQGTVSTTLSGAPPGGTASILPDYLETKLTVNMVSAPAAGGEVQLFVGFSPDGSTFTAGLTGADGAGPVADALPQIGIFCGSVIMSNLITTPFTQSQDLSPIPCLKAYIVPVVVNMASVTLSATAAATTITITPFYRERAV